MHSTNQGSRDEKNYGQSDRHNMPGRGSREDLQDRSMSGRHDQDEYSSDRGRSSWDRGNQDRFSGQDRPMSQGHQGYQGQGYQGQGYQGQGYQGQGYQGQGYQGNQGNQGYGHDLGSQSYGHQGSWNQGYGNQGMGSQGSGNQGYGGQAMGSSGYGGHQSYGGQGSGSQGSGSQGYGNQGFSNPGMGSQGYASQGMGTQGSQGYQGYQGMSGQGSGTSDRPWGQGQSDRSSDFARNDFRGELRHEGRNLSGTYQQNQSFNQGQRGFEGNQRQFLGKGPKGYTRSDERIREEICELLSEGHIDASEIEVKVQDCEVTLTGNVSDRRIKRMAEEIVEGARGVKDIHNQIKVQSCELRGSQRSEGLQRTEGAQKSEGAHKSDSLGGLTGGTNGSTGREQSSTSSKRTTA